MLVRCVAKLVSRMNRLQKKMTKRELVAYQAGLRAAHMEEAIVQGESDRAIAHARKLNKLMLELGG